MSTPTDTNAAAFIERISSDAQFQQSFEEFSLNNENVSEFAAAHGYEFTRQEFLAAWEEKFGKIRNEDGSLTEEALEGVSGGVWGLIAKAGPALARVGVPLVKWAVGGLAASIGIQTYEKTVD